jgi:hypothetical protein
MYNSPLYMTRRKQRWTIFSLVREHISRKRHLDSRNLARCTRSLQSSHIPTECVRLPKTQTCHTLCMTTCIILSTSRKSSPPSAQVAQLTLLVQKLWHSIEGHANQLSSNSNFQHNIPEPPNEGNGSGGIYRHGHPLVILSYSTRRRVLRPARFDRRLTYGIRGFDIAVPYHPPVRFCGGRARTKVTSSSPRSDVLLFATTPQNSDPSQFLPFLSLHHHPTSVPLRQLLTTLLTHLPSTPQPYPPRNFLSPKTHIPNILFHLRRYGLGLA